MLSQAKRAGIVTDAEVAFQALLAGERPSRCVAEFTSAATDRLSDTVLGHECGTRVHSRPLFRQTQ